MSAQHTPGPWFIWQELAMQRNEYEADEIESELLESPDHGIYAGNPVECTRRRVRGHTAHICDVDADSFDFDDDEDVCRATALANARLIAAAPELLEALKLAEFVMDDCPMVSQQLVAAVAKARAAIAKVEGGAA